MNNNYPDYAALAVGRPFHSVCSDCGEALVRLESGTLIHGTGSELGNFVCAPQLAESRARLGR